MRILIQHRDCGPSFVNRGWEGVFRHCGHDVRYWREERSLFDSWNDFNPDLFVGTTWTANEALLKLCRKSPATRVVLYAGTWGEVADPLDPDEYPVVKCSDGQKLFLERMKRETGRPDLVWLHLTPSYVDGVIGGYEQIGIAPAGITNAADVFTYLKGEERPEYACDLAFVGGNWPYKSKTINPYLGPLLHPDSGLHCKVWGNQGWSHDSYLGLLDESESRHVFRSARVCPSIGEPHSLIFSDIVERYYKVISSGGFVVGGPEVGIGEEFGDAVPTGHSPAEYQELIRRYVHDDAGREDLRTRQFKTVISRHTYFDRVGQLFDLLGMRGEADEIYRARWKYLDGVAVLTPSA